MINDTGKIKKIKIAYIGGGSRQWAWGFMSDLVLEKDISGQVYLYDIDFQAAKRNECIGNLANSADGAVTTWKYKAVTKIEDALKDADFVIISILPGTLDEMESDVHTPEKYGIYQSVGDTTGPGGLIRALRTIPMYEEIAIKVKEYCPSAWVISYTNPMTVCVRTLYRVFPNIKAFGCCHEVFGTQRVLIEAIEDILGMTGIKREDIKVNVVGVNHFTWITKAEYKNIDLFPIYKEFALKNKEKGLIRKDQEWRSKYFSSHEKVKFDLFLRYGIIAAAGDRHLAEFCPGDWYLKNEQQIDDWYFGLTPVSYRRTMYRDRDAKALRLCEGKEKFIIEKTGEDGVKQIRAILGLEDLITNVNMPNKGQIGDISHDAVVETNACFRSDCVEPIQSGEIPMNIRSLILGISARQELIVEAGLSRNLELAYEAFISDPLVRLSLTDSRSLFDEMIMNTKEYLKMY